MFPAPSEFHLHEECPEEGTQVIVVRGEIHVSTAPEFSERLTEALEGGSVAVVLDLGAVDFIDSTGLSVLLSGLRQVTRRQGALALVCANPTVLRLFEITRLETTFDIQPSREAALMRVRDQAGASADGAP